MNPTHRLWTTSTAMMTVVCLTALVACAAPERQPSTEGTLPLPAGGDQAARQIQAGTLAGYVRFLAHDLLEGRGPASSGDRLALAYLAASMESMGLEPGAGDGRWTQPFQIMGLTSRVPQNWSFRSDGGSLTLKRWDEFMATSGVQEASAGIDDGELVFVGYGIQAPEYDWDDFKDVDVRGKVLLMLNNDPEWDRNLFEGETRLLYGRWTYKYEMAARQGAAGAIIMHTTPSAGYPWQVIQTSNNSEQFELPAEGEPRLQVAAWATGEATRRLAAFGGHDLDQLVEAARSRDFEPVPLGIRTSLDLQIDLRRAETANVAGFLPGGDLEDEVVIYTAHYDHLGVGEADDGGDTIYNGARDNAAGVAQVLAIARAFTALPEPPRRSVLFLLVGGEEQGLLGSKYYAAHPTFPPGRIAANINFDSPNIWGRTTDITFLGYGKSTADRFVDAAAARQGRVVKGDQFPDRGYYYRSDQFNFAKIGVPAIYLKPGTQYIGRPPDWGREVVEAYEARSYHQPSDEFTEEWNLEGLVEDSRLGFEVGLTIAQSDEGPAWNPGDEFEAARLAALEGVSNNE
jgi:Zn-dependent M28 family amino/carboxypeptidase